MNDPKRVLIDLVAFLDGRAEPEITQRAVAQFGRDDVRAAAARMISCLAWKADSGFPRFGAMLFEKGEFGDMVRQWVNAEPKLRTLFEVRKNGVIFLRQDLPATVRLEIAKFALADIRRHMRVKRQS